MICGIDFGENIAPDYLKSLAHETGGSYHHMYGTHEFGRVFEDIYKRLRNYYVVEFTPQNFGKHITRVKLCTPKDTMQSGDVAYDNTPDIGAISLLDVTFDLNKADLKSESKKALQRVAGMMKAFSTMVIEVRGHTDSQNKTGDADYNAKLSQRRADAVCAALAKLGVPAERMHARGFGDTLPVADNTTDAGRAKNRRTEFVIISK
jgi:outer membrane protein OmpA-like peptidoglycan-associated protein